MDSSRSKSDAQNDNVKGEKEGLGSFDVETVKEEEKDIYPWLVVLSTFLILTVGLATGQSCDPTHLSLQLSFAQTIYNILINVLGPLSQLILSTLGPRNTLLVSVVISSLGLLLASFSTEVWHLYLTHGVVYGTGVSIMFYIALSIVPQYFSKHRGIALGLTSSGISIGGLVFPFIMDPLNSRFGANWCYRIMSLVCLVIGLLACCLLGIKKDANSNHTIKMPPLKETFDFSVAKDWRYLLWCITDILLEAGYNTPAYFLPSYATHLGLSSYQGALILSVGSGLNAIGRTLSGLLADYIGHVNVVILYCTLSGLSCLLVWTFATNFETLLAFSIIYGFFGGAFITLTPAIIMLVTGYEKFETGISVFLVITVVSMFGPNLAGTIESSVKGIGPFESYKYFTGSL
ncbi:hypothetical protein G6F57_004387 [Rhizopus arrhizus]|uniref:Major facilitator superfamily (MFS) profile domain-containing protein n=1 Tax=Rhizopus oryzae TaxID=64495 RepID=A0A9P6X630_RHIOR|nr:hypothetical protein G6F23_010744 [Rhizopus arrhizus]KAG1403636.1 hypothetical protein G6F58_010331 [Rhizopus delemar]KAG0761266.1 hypothetical protein G6F24_007698 [Rhizopus arrhizus]KAG0784125.1 hypothetical protein G6F21_010107 [Rhizopus arrhizus]KAG0801714.1 hypothetical protein G6F22_000971 [Rhizopus arrhizus]